MKKFKQVFAILFLVCLTIFMGFKAYESEAEFSKKTVETDSNETYASSNKPSVRYSTSKIVYQYSTFDPTSVVDTDYYVDVKYNNVDTSKIGNYTVVLDVCYYKGSKNCRTVQSTIMVRERKNSTSTSTTSNKYTSSKNNTTTTTTKKNYSSGPSFSSVKAKSCSYGSSSCLAEKIAVPTAKDPYSGRSLDVTLISGYVDIHTPGTYSLVYYAETEHGVGGTVARLVTIEERPYSSSNSSSSSNYYSRLPETKYVSNYHTDYYDDGEYAGYLTQDRSSYSSKYITDYKWYNTVSYTYRCTNPGYAGLDGWTYVSTNSPDDHPTYYYSSGKYAGTLKKTGFNCVEGCTEKLIPELGTCRYSGELKNITRTFVGFYSGYVYTDYEVTYSGTVYLK